MPGLTFSYLGDGISAVAVVLLAQELTGRVALVGLAVTVSSLPGAVGALLLGRQMSRFSGADLARWDATWRFVTLGSVPIAYAAGILGIWLYIALLAASSVLHTWGSAGRYTMIAEMLPQKHHLAGNSVLSVLGEIGTIGGPPVAALIVVFWNPAGALAVDALSFGVLALALRTVRSGRRPVRPESRTAGLALMRDNPVLLGLITLSALFFFLFGPVYVALPVRLDEATALAAFYSAFGVGAVLGGLVTPYLRSLWPTVLGSVAVVGLCLLPLGLDAPTPLPIIGFALIGVSWAPYQATSVALYQRIAPPEGLAQVLGVHSAVALLAVPAGVAAGGLLVDPWGAQTVLLVCAVGLITLPAVAAFGRVRTKRASAE
ncbi:MFS transporter [Kineosporia mesophila]|uniref:MFS transporter n=1 Tax=Kineosporia mesophila TaxID=566012 RepID=A0ABP7ANN4_9ACTN